MEVVTGDRDLFQLVDDARPVRIIYIARGVSKFEVVDEAAVTARYQIPGRAYAAFATLRGDPSDGLPGVSGVGEKTAAALVRVFGSVDAMLRRWTRATAGSPWAPGPSCPRPAATCEAAVPVVRVATTRRCPRSAGAAGRPGRRPAAGRTRRALGPRLLPGPDVAALAARPD